MTATQIVLAGVLLTATSIPARAQNTAVPVVEPAVVQVSTTAETNALVGAINGFRAKLGLAALVVDAGLSQRAEAGFPAFANTSAVVDVTSIEKEFAAKDVAVLRGAVTHRGKASGAEFPKYWAQDARWNAMMTGDYTHIGVATAKRSDGKLVALAYLIKR